MSDNSHNESDRSRGVVVYKMPEEIGGPAVFGVYALMVRHNDTGEIDTSEVRMVHTEGVAYSVTDEKPWCWTDYDDTQKTWTPQELITAADGDKACDLADWVRTFGARLESNFRLCYGWAVRAEWAS
jgi:hypothetical protein